jgi:hypothetical protein
MVLILDGEELVGAKQNRIVNTTILVAAGAEIVIPVSCVEQGRWTYKSDAFSSKHRVMSPSIRKVKECERLTAQHWAIPVRPISDLARGSRARLPAGGSVRIHGHGSCL